MNTLLLPLLFLALPGVAPLVATEASADKGTVKTGPALVHEFEVKHTGDRGILTITGVATSCGCSRWEASPKVLKPGETAKITASINTLTQPEGAALWKASVAYSAAYEIETPKRHQLELQLAAKLVREISVDPPVLAVSTSGDTPRSYSLRVTDRRTTGALSIQKASCTNPNVKLTIEKSSGQWDIAVAIPGDIPLGAHDDIITLTTTDTAAPELKIPLKINKRATGDVSISPDVATVRFTKNQDDASTLVQLRAGGKAIAIQKVECAQAGVTIKFSEGSGPVATARIIVNRAQAGPFGQADVTIYLTEPTPTTLTLPLTWFVPDGK